MFHKLMRALRDGYNSFVEELEDSLDKFERAEETRQHIEVMPLPHDCANDLKDADQAL